MNDDFLTKFCKEPRPEFAAALYQRISKPMQTQTKYRTMRVAALTLSVPALLMVTLLVSPSARVFAQGILHQIGGYVFTQGTPRPDSSKAPSPIQIVRTHDSVLIETTGFVPEAQDSSGASKMAGFGVLTPTYLPDGYSAMGNWFITSQGNGMVVTNGYRDSTNNFLIFNQWKYGEGDARQTYDREQIVDVTVRGQPGVWLPDPASPNGKNALVWVEGNITYSLLTNSLSLDEMLKVAESLRQ